MNAVKIIARSAAIVIAFVASIYTGIWLAELALKLHQSLVEVIATQRVLEFATGNPIWVIAAVAFVWMVISQMFGLDLDNVMGVTAVVTLFTTLAYLFATDSLHAGSRTATEAVSVFLGWVWIIWSVGFLLVLSSWGVAKFPPPATPEEAATAGEEQ